MNGSFSERVYAVVLQIPYGRVMTYGDVAALAGQANAARTVGGVAHFGDPRLPWHRIVNRAGGLASGYHGGKLAHQSALELEGLEVKDFYLVDFKELRWLPNLR